MGDRALASTEEVQSQIQPGPDAAAIRVQLSRLKENPVFIGSDRLVDFLQFIVEATLDNRAATLKEAVIGNAVYGRNPPYDPRIDSTVRVEARRLRRKLDEYYVGVGKSDPIRIGLPIGGYVPSFSFNSTAIHGTANDELEKRVFGEGAGASIAILPFRAVSSSSDEERFSDGLTEELTYGLSELPGLRVTSRSVAFQYKNSPSNVADLAAELGVNAIIQGTVRYDADKIRVTIEICDPQGFVVFSDRIDAPSGEPLSVQEQITLTLVSRIRFDSSHMRTKKVGASRAALDAMGKVYRARRLLDQQLPSSINEALELFTSVCDDAPDYARGYTGVADCHCDLYRLGVIDRHTALSKAEAYVRRALEIDPQSVEAHSGLAVIAAWLNWDRHAAATHFTKAIELGANARASRLFGVLLTIMEEHDAADRQFKEARRIEPFSSQQDIAEAVCYYQARRSDAFMALGERPAKAAEAIVFAALYQVLNRGQAPSEEVLVEIERATQRTPDLVFARAEIEAWSGEKARASKLRAGNVDGATHFAKATLSASLGDFETTIAELAQAMEARELSSVWIKTDTRFDGLRHTGKFVDLVKRLPPNKGWKTR